MFFSKKPQVAHIRLNGIIGNVGRFQQGMSLNSHEQIIKKAFNQKKLSAVAISINSPGGSPVQSHLIFSFIRKLATEKKVKVITFGEHVAGSIGVIYSSFGLKELIKKIGIERRVHTAGKNKSTLDPFMDEKPEDIERLKKIQLDLHEQFINLVKNSRKNKLPTDKDDSLFSGEFWSGTQSKELGLVDGLGNMEDIIQEKFGKKVLIKKYDKPESWLKKKLSNKISNEFSSVFDELESRSLWNKFGL